MIKLSSEDKGEKQRLVLIGQPGEGKTFCAATMSDKFDPTFAKPATLDDMLWFKFDDGSFDGFHEKGVVVPSIDFTGSRTLKDFDCSAKSDSYLYKAVMCADKLARDGKLKCVVVDTLSSADRVLFSLYHMASGNDTRRAYGDILSWHRSFYVTLRALPCHIVFLVHPKAKPESQQTNSELRNFEHVLDLSGQSGSVYRANASLIAVVRQVKQPNKPSEFSLHPRGFGGIEGKCRYACLADREEANLKKIYEKVATAIK